MRIGLWIAILMGSQASLAATARCAELLSDAETESLVLAAKQGDVDARNRLTQGHMGLVARLAKRFARPPVADYEDLLQEGVFALHSAISRYDPKLSRFGTYAARWLAGNLRRAVHRMAPVPIPEWVRDEASRWKAITSDLERRLGRRPFPEELRVALELTPECFATRANVIPRLENQLKRAGQDTLLLDEVECRGRYPSPLDHLILEEEKEMGLWLVETQLTDREKTVLKFRWGLGGNPSLTLVEIGRQLGITYQAVFQAEHRALRKLREAVGRGDPAS